MVSAILTCIFSSLIIVVFLVLSSPMVRLCVLASSVRLMYNASSFAVSCLATVVLPVHGVPVMSMTRFMSVFEVDGVVIGCASGLTYWKSNLGLFALFCCFFYLFSLFWVALHLAALSSLYPLYRGEYP